MTSLALQSTDSLLAFLEPGVSELTAEFCLFISVALENYWTCLGLSLLVCKMGMTMVLSSWIIYGGLNEVQDVKCLASDWRIIFDYP